jgi:hypothetical protein
MALIDVAAMFIWPNSRVILACGAMLISLAMTQTTYAADSASLSTHVSFDLATYREMKKSDQGALGLILTAMRETVLGAGQNGREGMGNVYIEARPKSLPPATAATTRSRRSLERGRAITCWPPLQPAS